MSDTCQPCSSGSSAHTLNIDAIWPHTHSHTNTHTSAVLLYMCVFLRIYFRAKKYWGICRTRTKTKHISPLHWDILQRVMKEHSVTHQNAAQCNSTLPVISKKSPLPNTPPQGFQENSLFLGKSVTHTPTQVYLSLFKLYTSLSIPQLSCFFGFSQSNLCLVSLPSFFLFLSAPYPPPFCVYLVKPVW